MTVILYALRKIGFQFDASRTSKGDIYSLFFHRQTLLAKTLLLDTIEASI